MEQPFHPAYFSTRFWVEGPERMLLEYGVILSGFATTGQRWPPEQNWQSDRALERALRSRSEGSLVRMIGYSPRLDHAEPSWLSAMGVQEACELGLGYKQDALYMLLAGDLFVVSCMDPDRRAYVGRFADRLDWLDTEAMSKCLQGDGPFRFGM